MERKGFSGFFFFSFLFSPRGTRRAARRSTPRFAKMPIGALSLFARLWGREGNWWGNRVAGEGRGFVDRFAARLFASSFLQRCVRVYVESSSMRTRARARACVEKEREFVTE